MAETGAAEAKVSIPLFGRDRPKPGRYFLDLKCVRKIPFTWNDEQTTFGEVYDRLANAKHTNDPAATGLEQEAFATPEGTVIVSSDREQLGLLRVLCRLVRLQEQGADPDCAYWFYYDHDWSVDMQEVNTFFVIHNGKVIDESFAFFNDEPVVLKKDEDEGEPIWHYQPSFAEASEIYWYQKFYTETVTGQLMVLRPDEPILYHFARPSAPDTSIRDIEFVTLIKLYRLLWVAVALLVAIAYPHPPFSDFMLIVAAVLFVDVLWRCWATRKVGQAR